MTQKPQRIQLKRTRGFDLQAVSLALNGLPAVRCARPGKWGNPVKVGMSSWEASQALAKAGGMRVDVEDPVNNKAEAVKLFRFWRIVVPDRTYDPRPSMEELRRELAGHNLACFCKTTDECHCDVLLELANKEAV